MKHINKQFLKGKKVLITAGPTREYLDPVRYISNDSSGKTGYELAKAAKSFGAKVTLISGPTDLAKPKGVGLVKVISAHEMFKATKRAFKNSDITICAAAVSDFRPINLLKAKIKKTNLKDKKFKLSLIKNPDILESLGKIKKQGQLLVGFALETENMEKNAKRKLIQKNCDVIIANTPKNIGSDSGELFIYTDKGKIYLKKMRKPSLAKKILLFVIKNKCFSTGLWR